MKNKKVFKVLIVDHSQNNLLSATQVLQDKGFHVERARSGYEALEALNESTYDLILMGCDMPDMDGFETADLIRDDSLFSQSRIPIVVWSSSYKWNVRKRCRQVGIDDFISGPFSVDHLYSRVQYWINRLHFQNS